MVIKNLAAMQETRWEDSLEKDVAIHSSILAWRIPWTEEPGGLQAMRLQRVKHDFSDPVRMHTYLSNHYKVPHHHL